MGLASSILCQAIVTLAEPSDLVSSSESHNCLTQSAVSDSRLISPVEINGLVKKSSTETLACSATSVKQLSGVLPTDWEFHALQSLAERYDLPIKDELDQKRASHQAFSRLEFVTLLSVTLQHMSQPAQHGTNPIIAQCDIDVLQRLLTSFAPELAQRQARVNTIETETAELEAQQFSTTTQLKGQVIFAVNSGGFTGDRIIAPRGALITEDNPRSTFIYRVSLSLNTSFSGTDLLQVRLVTGSDGADDNAAGLLEPNLGSTLDFSIPGRNTLSLARLYYSFVPTPDLSVTLGPSITSGDFIDQNRYAGTSFLDFSTQALGRNFILSPRGRGTGAAINWNPSSSPFSARAVYIAGDATNTLPENQAVLGGGTPDDIRLFPTGGGGAEGGLFGDPYQGVIELEYAPSHAFALRLQYSGGEVFGSKFKAIGVNGKLAVSDRVGLFGRYGYSSYPNTTVGDINPSYWMFGLSVSDLFMEDAIAGIAVGQPFIESQIGSATQTNFEAFYNMPMNKYIRVTPLIQVINNPGNQAANSTVITGTIRTVFSF